MKVTEVAAPSEQDFEVLKAGLGGYNEGFTGRLYREKVSCFVKDESGVTRGGIIGEIKWGWLYVEGLWLSDDIRIKGLGTKLLNKLEDYARSKGISNFRLETTSFQALAFYEKQGYVLFGQLPDMPPGFISYFLKKQTKV